MRLGFVLLAVALDAVTSHAAVTTQVGSFDMSTPFVQGSGATADPGFSFFDRFDASLGTLTRVDIDISVATLVQGVLPLSQICSIGCVPVPYPFTFQIVHDFGLWPIPGGPTNPRIEYSGLADGLNQAFASTTASSHGLSLTAFTDTAGLAVISSSSSSAGLIGNASASFVPPVITGLERADFATPLPGLPLTSLFPVLRYAWAGQGIGAPVTGVVTSSGTITLSYVYEPATSPAAEPATLTLLALGLVCASYRRPRR